MHRVRFSPRRKLQIESGKSDSVLLRRRSEPNLMKEDTETLTATELLRRIVNEDSELTGWLSAGAPNRTEKANGRLSALMARTILRSPTNVKLMTSALIEDLAFGDDVFLPPATSYARFSPFSVMFVLFVRKFVVCFHKPNPESTRQAFRCPSWRGTRGTVGKHPVIPDFPLHVLL